MAFGLLSGCCVGGGVSGSDCEALVDKILICDPTAASASRAALATQCAWTSPRCVTLDVSTPPACAAFMGCLYDD